MAINKKLIHFKTFENFNSHKLSANEENTKYTLGADGEVLDGTPDILYQSIVWIKDAQKQWTHGQLYDGGGNSVGTAILEFNPSGLTDEQKAHNAEIYQKINNGVAIQIYFSGGFAFTPLNVRSRLSGAGIGTVYVLSADAINTAEPSSLAYMSFKLSSDGDIQIYEQKEYPLSLDTELSDTSENAVQNKTVTSEFNKIWEIIGAKDFSSDFNTDYAIY